MGNQVHLDHIVVNDLRALSLRQKEIDQESKLDQEVERDRADQEISNRFHNL